MNVQIDSSGQRKRAAELLSDADAKDRLRFALEPVACPVPCSDVHPYALHGAAGSLTFGAKDRFKAKDIKALTLADLVELVKAFPPSDIVHARDGCLWFCPPAGVTERAQVRAIAPFIVTHEPAVEWDAWLSVNWWTPLAGAVYEIQAYLPSDLWPIRSRVAVQRARNGALISVETMPPDTVGGFVIDDRVTFASGSAQDPKRSVAFWDRGPEWSEPLQALAMRWPALRSIVLPVA